MEHKSLWAIPLTMIATSVHLSERDAAAELLHTCRSTLQSCLLFSSLVMNALKSFGFLVTDPCKMQNSLHLRGTNSWLLIESWWYESVEKMKFCFAAIWPRIWRHATKRRYKLFKVWKSAFPSWINIEPFRYCSSTSWPSMIKCSIDGLLVFVKSHHECLSNAEQGTKGKT